MIPGPPSPAAGQTERPVVDPIQTFQSVTESVCSKGPKRSVRGKAPVPRRVDDPPVRCSGWLRLNTVLGFGYPRRRIELPNAWSEHGVKPLQLIAEPRVLPRPIMPVARVRRFEDERDVAFYLPRQLPPVELLPELLLDLLLFFVKQVKAWLGVWSAHLQEYGDRLP
jgi:hypothetical protein